MLGDDQNPKQLDRKPTAKPLAGGNVAKPVEKPAVATPPPAMASAVKDTKAILESSPHVNFIVPLAEGEKPGAFEEPQINGYKMKVPKGTMVNIPIQIANLLAEKYKIAMEAGKESRIDRDSGVEEALS